MKNRSIFKKCSAILAMTIILAVSFPLKACAKEENPTGIITMTTTVREVWFTAVGTKDITIDWGDGKKSNVNDAEYFEDSDMFVFRHDYSGETTHSIVINGNITWFTCASIGLTALDVSRNPVLTRLDCRNNQLTALDVSKNTALTELRCSQNQLVTLDVGKNAALESLDLNFNQITHLNVSNNTSLGVLGIVGNQLTTSALNDLFRTLPDYSKLENMFGVIYLRERHPLAIGNPGNSDCDRNIANERGWGFMSIR